ncbi:MAG TPA: glycerophosphodiester phosphodiesterase [Acidimicrobiales bacterium]|nr:glycerophosphodiester phosphodiesterase [Acidimicrobiales bacterium]
MPREAPLRPPIGFAHRGARADAPENTLEAFELAIRLGARGLESDVWLTADGHAVLDHDGLVGPLMRRRRIDQLTLAELPEHIPTLDQLYETCGTDFDLSLDVKDPAAFDRTLAIARAGGDTVVSRLWLCHHDWTQISEWRRRDESVRLVDSTRVKLMKEGPERRAAQLSDAGIDTVNLHHSDVSAGLVALFHRFDRYVFGWDAQHARVLRALVDMGVDGLYSDHVARMVAVLSGQEPAPPGATDGDPD